MLLVYCFIAFVVFHCATSHFLIRLAIGSEARTRERISDEFTSEVIHGVNKWFLDYNVSIQWTDLVPLPDPVTPTPDLILSAGYWGAKLHDYQDEYYDFYQIWTVTPPFDSEGIQSELTLTSMNPCDKKIQNSVVSVTNADGKTTSKKRLQIRSIMSVLAMIGLMNDRNENCTCLGIETSQCILSRIDH
jgi:hypothetical protein